ncbi:MAG: hypothetical protein J6P37_04730 [Lachnospiraceae bacterium]|nr:hypothetical protein [Lachnospiraceae bacterium]
MNNNLSQKLKKRKGKIIYLLAIEVLLIFLVIYFLFYLNDYINAIRVAVTLLLTMIPLIMEILFSMSIPWPMYCFLVIYATEHTIGTCFNVYLYLSWWDDMMHFTEGFMFAMFGYYYLSFGDEKKFKTRIKNLVFGIALAILLEVLWEIVEYIADSLFLFDMQKDVLVTEFHTYLLTGNNGDLETVDNIKEVIVDGRVLPGYIDIGLNDTMRDMITALVGAVSFSVYCLIDREKHPLLKFEKRS